MLTSKTANPKQSASLARVGQAALDLGLEIDIRHLPEGTRSAKDAARAQGCDVAQIVKSIILRKTDGPEHFLFLTSGDKQVDLDKAANLVGAPVKMGDAASIRDHTGFAIGGVSPLGHLKPITTYFDENLWRFETIWAAAGTPSHVFEIATQALHDALAPLVADFTA